MSSIFTSTLNTRVLPIGSVRFVRSDLPNNLTETEYKWLLDNNVFTVVDLREEKEFLRSPCSLENDSNFNYYHLPVTGGGDTPKCPEDVAKTYIGMIDEQMDKIIDTIMNSKSNVIYFCGAGKDRTGVVSAIILRKLGYNDDVIISDYMDSKENLNDFLYGYVKDHPEVDIKTILPNENNIRAVLDLI